jgi:hypothetical protein
MSKKEFITALRDVIDDYSSNADYNVKNKEELVEALVKFYDLLQLDDDVNVDELLNKIIEKVDIK